jgi:alkylation response protein AidB-like acyl-CoA dehydrogenase
MEASRSVSHELSRLIARQGWIGVTISDRYGGMGMGHLAKTVIIEELARVSGAMVQASQLGVAKIVHFGTEEQKKRWLPAIASGDCLPTIAVTEPDSGGHVLGMTSSAIRDGDDYLLNGRKVFVGNSHVGDLHGVVVRTGPGSKGLSAFLVESGRPGFPWVPRNPRWVCMGSASESWFSTTAGSRRPTGSVRREMACPSRILPACSTGAPTSPPFR